MGIKYDDKTSRAEAYDLVTKTTSGIKVMTFHELHFRHGVDVDVLKTLSAEMVSSRCSRLCRMGAIYSA